MGVEVGADAEVDPDHEAEGGGGGECVPGGWKPAVVKKDEGAVEGLGVELELAELEDHLVEEKGPEEEESAGQQGKVAVAADAVDAQAEKPRHAGDEEESGVADEEGKKLLGLAW